MKQLLFIMTSMLCLTQVTYAADVQSLFPSFALSDAHAAVKRDCNIQDSSGKVWRVYSTLPPHQRLARDYGSLKLTPLNSRPIIISPETLCDFFQGCADVITRNGTNTVQIGLKYIYPATIQQLANPNGLSTPHYVFLVRSIPTSEASNYPRIPSFTELEKAFMRENRRILEANSGLYNQTCATFIEQLRYSITATFIIASAAKFIFPTWVFALCAYPIILILQTLFIPTGLFTAS